MIMSRSVLYLRVDPMESQILRLSFAKMFATDAFWSIEVNFRQRGLLSQRGHFRQPILEHINYFSNKIIPDKKHE